MFLNKSKVLPFPISTSKAINHFELIHSDVWGPSPIISTSRFRYFITFIDDCTRFTWVYLLRKKSDVFQVFKYFVAMIENQFQKTIKVLRSDSGGEYTSNEFQTFLLEKGISHERSCPETPQQNGIAERKNRHILDIVRALLLEAVVPPTFWDEAVRTSVFLINRQISKRLQDQSPYFLLYNKPPSYDMLHTFGCICYVHLSSLERTKLTPQSVECVFLGYAVGQKGFRCYDPKSKKNRISRNVVFQESAFYYHKYSSLSPTVSSSILHLFQPINVQSNLSNSSGRFKPDLVYTRQRTKGQTLLPRPANPSQHQVLLPPSSQESEHEEDNEPNSDSSPEHITAEISNLNHDSSQSGLDMGTAISNVRRSTRPHKAPARYGFLTSLSSIKVPETFKQVMQHACWKSVMKNELDALHKNET
jgi:transposase InsO family protein